MSKKTLAISAALAAAFTSSAALAEVTANVGIASTYLWRGTDLSTPSPQVSGGVDYAHESGFYAGVWHGSEGNFAGPETDLYAGFSGEAGDISYDVGFIAYKYLQQESLGFGTNNDFEEVYFGIGFQMIGFSYAIDSDNDTAYLSLSAELDDFSIAYGAYTFDNSPISDYSHVDLSYALTDSLSVTYSIPSFDNPATVEDPTLVFSYGWEFDVK